MKNTMMYQDDPFAEAAAKTDLPVLGKDWTPGQQRTRKQSQETSPDEKKSKQGTKPQMQDELRYTSVLKKDKGIDKKEAIEKVSEIVERSNTVLMKMTAVFPFDFFPNVVTIDANKVTIIDKNFFASESVVAILLEEITDIVVESNFFLARIVITYSHHPLQPEHYAVANLRKKEALRAQEIIQGLLVLRLSEGIDLSKLQPDQITKELARIGKRHENLPAL